MAKRLVIKVGEYQKDGETKGEYVRLGVLLESNDGGEYVLLDPTVNLAGCLMKQRVMNQGKEKKGKGDMVMCSIFADEQNRQSTPQSSGSALAGSGSASDFDDDIGF